MDICQIGYDICEFDSLIGINIGRVHFDNRDRFSISMGSIGKATEPYVNKEPSGCWHLAFDCFLNLHMRDEYEIFIASCTNSIHDLENERWLFGDMIDHIGIYGSTVAEGLSTLNVILVFNLQHSGAGLKYGNWLFSSELEHVGFWLARVPSLVAF